MPTFRRIKIQATVETPMMLLPENDIDRALGEFLERLKRLDLSVLSVAPAEPEPVRSMPDTTAEDPWSIRDTPVE